MYLAAGIPDRLGLPDLKQQSDQLAADMGISLADGEFRFQTGLWLSGLKSRANSHLKHTSENKKRDS